MRIRFLFVGKSDDAEYARGVERYVARIARFAPAEVVIVREEKPGAKAGRRSRGKPKEASGSSRRSSPETSLVLCDERGKDGRARSSPGTCADGSIPVPLVGDLPVGGAFGLDPYLRPRARAILPLSRMTLPHQLARVVLAEQVYRAIARLTASRIPSDPRITPHVP